MAGKNVTMSDIAKDMGVSTVTVSKAITGKDGVSKEVRDKILARAREIGYIYSKAPKEEAQKRYNVGIIVGENFIDDKDTFYIKMYQKVMLELTEQNHFSMFEIIKREAQDQNNPPMLLSGHKIDGLIVLGQMKKEYMEMMRSFHIPMMLLDFYDETYLEDSVISDGIYGSCILTKYLIAKGHTKIGYIGNLRSTSSIMDRYIGYYKAMLQSQLPIKKEWILEDRDKNGRYIEIQFPSDMPTAFVCNCDEVAFNVIKELKKKGYKVPADISVVGFDNFIYSYLSSPKITSFGVDLDNMVQNAVRIIINKINDPEFSVGRVVVSGSMYERNSVSAL